MPLPCRRKANLEALQKNSETLRAAAVRRHRCNTCKRGFDGAEEREFLEKVPGFLVPCSLFFLFLFSFSLLPCSPVSFSLSLSPCSFPLFLVTCYLFFVRFCLLGVCSVCPSWGYPTPRSFLSHCTHHDLPAFLFLTLLSAPPPCSRAAGAQDEITARKA